MNYELKKACRVKKFALTIAFMLTFSFPSGNSRNSCNSWSSPLTVEATKDFLFSSPLHFRTFLAGNFGETRPRHFHGGIDIKTQGKEGKAVFAIGDGYITSVITNHPTVGNAIVVKHPQGYLSMYCHLQRFAPHIRPRIPVAQGQIIAISGSTGVSQGPHLHLELHDSKTGQLLDPLDYTALDITDNTPPELHEIKVYPQDTLSHICGSREPKTIPAPPSPTHSSSLRVVREIRDPSSLIQYAWGHLAFAINANDYMEGSANRLGIRLIQFYVDRQLVYQRTMQAFMPTDHPLAEQTSETNDGKCYIYTWLPKDIRSSLFATDAARGIVNIDSERDYNLVYLLTDQQGNQSHYAFTVRGKKNVAPKEKEDNELNDEPKADTRKKADAQIRKKANVEKNRKKRHRRSQHRRRH